MLRHGQHVVTTGLQRVAGEIVRTTPAFTTIKVGNVKKTVPTSSLIAVRSGLHA